MSPRRTVVITGGSSGIGLAAAQELARRGDEIVLVGRHPQRLARAVEKVREAGGSTPRAYRADFAVLDEVRHLAQQLTQDLERVDVLANNAGALAPLTRRTVDGHDVTMQVNHVSGFLLAQLLHELMRATAAQGSPVRLITTASLAEAWAWLDVSRPTANLVRYRSRWLAYGASKQANILFTVEAARRWTSEGIIATCFFPGLVQTRFARTSLLFTLARPLPGLIRTPKGGADTLVWLATAEEALVPGGYFAYRAAFPATPRSTDPERARALWESTSRAAGLQE